MASAKDKVGRSPSGILATVIPMVKIKAPIYDKPPKAYPKKKNSIPKEIEMIVIVFTALFISF